MATTPPHRQTSGFTIIEVLIVLAIVGAILLIVFLVVPTLQRNERNYSRERTVELVAGALEEYNNTYGQYPQSPGEYSQFISSNPEITRYYDLAFRNTSDAHGYWPAIDDISVQYAHWCNRYGNGDLATDPIAGDHDDARFYAVWTVLEPASASPRVFCVDNYGR